MSLTLRSLAIMFITYFIQPWKYYNIGEEDCQEVNGILVTDCNFLGTREEMWIFLAFWEGLFGLWINYELFVNFFGKRIMFVPTSPYLKEHQNGKMGKIGLRDVRPVFQNLLIGFSKTVHKLFKFHTMFFFKQNYRLTIIHSQTLQLSCNLFKLSQETY